MVWSYAELGRRLDCYWAALSARSAKLFKIFLGIVGMMVATIALFVLSLIPAFWVDAGLVAAFFAMCLLATYLVVSAKSFQETHGVFCPHCEATLLRFADTLEAITHNSKDRPESLECPQCRNVVVKNEPAEKSD